MSKRMVLLRRLAHVVSVMVLFLGLSGRVFAQSQPTKRPQPRLAESPKTETERQHTAPTVNVTITTPEKTADEKRAEAERADRQDRTNERIAEANEWMSRFTFFL